ncbi:hypothetical protein [Saccharibacillus endophyticus]|uniref:DUF4129 domain-containing protein n=1 Tax=Saccharibacillus endophyticus TaxID=2060666 RepID=A0ABQ2A3B1_9BACL|nr:hypothetical protein [Saccharibacillus endophyticus]GGH85341.1 hypothetical protein GCM10007362_42550 [Saccharibacillus endophyticus]
MSKRAETPPVSTRIPLLKDFGRPAAYSLLETLSVYAVVVLLAHYVLKIPDILLVLPIFAIHALASWIGLRQAEKRVSAALSFLPFGVALLSLLAFPGGWLEKGAGAAVLILIALRGLIVGRRQLWDNMWLRIPLSGVAAILIVYIIAGRGIGLMDYRPFLYLVATLILALTLLLLNGDRVRNAAGEQTSALANVLAANRKLTWIVAVLIVLAGIIGGPTGVLNAIREWWLSIFGGSLPGNPPGVQPSSQMPTVDYSQLDELGDASGPPLWLKIIGYALLALFWIAAAVAVGWLLYRLFGRWLPNGIRNLIRNLASKFGLMRELRSAQSDSNYTDKAEKIATEKSGGLMRFLRRKRHEPEYTGDDPRLRYRSVLLGASRKGYSLRSSRTPSENGKELSSGSYTEMSPIELEKLVERYNRARYGGKQERD